MCRGEEGFLGQFPWHFPFPDHHRLGLPFPAEVCNLRDHWDPVLGDQSLEFLVLVLKYLHQHFHPRHHLFMINH